MGNLDKLGQFRERGSRQPAAARPATRSPASQSASKVPAGYDPVVWDLAQEFTSTAASWNVGLAAGLPVIHNLLAARIKSSSLRDVPGWENLVRRMIKVFWDDEVDVENEAYAASQFCGESWDNCLVAVKRYDDAQEWRKKWQTAPRQQSPLAVTRTGEPHRKPWQDLPEDSGEPVQPVSWDELRDRARTITQQWRSK